MKRVLMSASALALGATAATAGGVERSSQSVGILFEQGNYVELTYGNVSPTVSGAFALTGAGSGDMAATYNTFSLGMKQEFGNKIDVAVILDQPIGANVSYPITAVGYPIAGSTAKLTSSAVTAILKYNLTDAVSVYGGLRSESVKGDVFLTAIPGGYTMSTETSRETGYLVGAAWEKPDIAARVALTYNSEIAHTLNATETGFFGSVPGTFETIVPKSVNLEFQTGIAADTLLFGSVRWQEWSKFVIAPTIVTGLTGSPLVDYADDVITYNLGVGRKFNEHWSGAVTLGYEKSGGGIVGNLGPTDGYKSIGLAATYTNDNVKVTGGIRYVDVGDAMTQIGPSNGVFADNSAIGVGLRVGISF